MNIILLIITFFLSASLGAIVGVYAVTSSVCIDMLSPQDFERLQKAVEKRSKEK